MKNLLRYDVFELGGVSTKRYIQATGESTANLVREVFKRSVRKKVNLN